MTSQPHSLKGAMGTPNRCLKFCVLLFCGLTVSSAWPQDQSSISLLGHLSFPVEKIRDVWAYVDTTTEREFALVGYRHERDRGIFIIDVTNPTNLRLASQINSVPSFDVKTFRHYAYAVYGTPTPEARVIDLRNPEQPIVVGSFPSGHNLTISPTGYMFLEDPGLRIFDLNSDPTKPLKIWDDRDPDRGGHDSAVVDNRLYDFHGYAGTKIFDVTTPESPRLIGLVQDPAVAFHHSGWVTANEQYLFICDEQAKPRGQPADITVWDIRDVANPTKVAGFADSSATAHNLYIVGDYAFISYYTAGFRILDVSDPTDPILVDTYDTAPNLDGPEFKGAFGVYPFSSSGNIYVSDTESGLYVFGFSAPTSSDSTGYPADPPVVRSFHPAGGLVGTTVTVDGENFADATEVRFGEGPISSFTILSPSQILATVPIGAFSGKIHVRTTSGTGESSTSFQVLSLERAVVQFGASDDSYVSSKRPNSDNSGVLELRVRRTKTASQIAFFKFPVSGLTGKLVSARLRLYTVEASDDGGAVYLVGNHLRDGSTSWGEKSLNWDNAPLLPGTPLSSLGLVTANEYVEFDVSAAVIGEGVWSFAIRNNSLDVVKYASRESSQPPVLLVDVESTPGLQNVPVVDSFTPAEGAAGTQVTVTGLNFLEVVSVRFNSMAAPDFTVDSDGQLRVVVPDAATTGKITLENRNGIGASVGDFKVLVENGDRTYLFTPTDDAFVSSKNISTNYSNWRELRVRKSVSAAQVTYLKFQVTGVLGPLHEAKLRLFSIDESDQGGSVHLVSNNYRNTSTPWREAGLDWTTAPSPETREISSNGIVVSDTTVEWDVKSALSGDGVYSFAIRNSSNNAVKYSSKEGVAIPELVIVTGNGLSDTAARDQVLLPRQMSRSSEPRFLDHNFPNPFNVETRISYHLKEPSTVRLIIYNTKGQQVRRLVNDHQPAGRRMARWNGRDDSGAVVGTGVYIYVLEAGAHRHSGKMILQK